MDFYARWFNSGNDYTKVGGGNLGEYASTGGSCTVVVNHQRNYYFAD